MNTKWERCKKFFSPVGEIVNNFNVHGGGLLAAAISFYAILSIIPFTLIFTAIMGQILHSSLIIHKYLNELLSRFVPSSSDKAVEIINNLIKKKVTFGLIGIFIFYWSGSRVFETAIHSLRRIYGIKKQRFFMQNKVFSFLIIPLLIITAILFIGLTRLVLLLYHFSGNTFINIGLGHITIFIPFLLSFGFLFLMYKVFAINIVDTRSALIGAGFTSIFSEIARYLFDWYIRNFNHFGEIYGSLSTAIIAILWIYYLSIIFILGAEITHFLSSKKRKIVEG